MKMNRAETCRKISKQRVLIISSLGEAHRLLPCLMICHQVGKRSLYFCHRSSHMKTKAEKARNRELIAPAILGKRVKLCSFINS